MSLPSKGSEISPLQFEFNQGLAEPCHLFFEPLDEVSLSYIDTHDRFLYNLAWEMACI